MKTAKLFLLSALLFFFCTNLSAQVTIGGLTEPETGAILDLNSTTKGGLLLSNVVLDNLYTIPYQGTNPFPGVTTTNHDFYQLKEEFAGAMVYHTGGNSIPAGIYVWNKTNWTPLTENCTAPALTLTAPLFIKQGATVAFSVASDASARCAEGETYNWFKTNVDGSTFNPSFGTTASVTTSFADEGDYKVKVEAKSPYSPTTIVEEKDVTVTADGGPAPSMLTYTYGIVGETCLDVKKSAQGKSQATFNARTNAFEGGFTKKYRFVHSDAYSDLRLSFYDPDHLVAGITPPLDSAPGSGEKEFTVTFKLNVKDLVPANGDSLTVRLYASYKPESISETKYAWLEIRIEDGTCICPAKINTNPETWLNFMCHNLGGLDIISSSQLITREHHGDWYRFGAKNASMKNTSDNDERKDGTWDNANYHTVNGNWPDNDVNENIGNPCPAGWRLPNGTELTAATVNSYNIATDVPAGTWTNGAFSNLKKLGDALMLPAAGRRNPDGQLNGRGDYGYYWSSTAGNNATVIMFYLNGVQSGFGVRTAGFSVRCVEK